jgi:hypothetical protein
MRMGHNQISRDPFKCTTALKTFVGYSQASNPILTPEKDRFENNPNFG